MRSRGRDTLNTATLFVTLLFSAFFIATSQAQAVEYDCGTYSSGDYNQECDDSTVISPADTSDSPSPSGTDDTIVDDTPDPVAENIPESAIILNNYSEYASADGITLDLVKDQIVYFKIGAEMHTITIKLITDEYVVFTIASTPTDVTVKKGQTVNYDVNGDGTSDIALSYVSRSGESVSVVFKQLAVKTVDVPADQESVPTGTPWWIWLIILGGGTIGIATTYIIMRRRGSH